MLLLVRYQSFMLPMILALILKSIFFENDQKAMKNMFLVTDLFFNWVLWF